MSIVRAMVGVRVSKIIYLIYLNLFIFFLLNTYSFYIYFRKRILFLAKLIHLQKKGFSTKENCGTVSQTSKNKKFTISSLANRTDSSSSIITADQSEQAAEAEECKHKNISFVQ